MIRKEEITGQLPDIDYVSFDVFDTLLLRMTRAPSQIFDKMYEVAPELFPNYISSCEWRHMRVYAEAQAKEKKKGEITLEDIYREIPAIITNPDKIMKIELRTEQENTFLNPEIEALLQEIKSKYNKRVILTSDMYLSQRDMTAILQSCGMDMTLVDRIFISSECGAKKSDGTIFPYISRKLCCKPESILHIGDNWKADYLNAKRAGWKSAYYSLISEAGFRYPYLGYEKEFYGDIGREIYAMRILAAGRCSLEGEEKEWFEMGAMALGPLLTYAAEWVLDLAQEKGITNIYPLMREGRFLAYLIKRAAKERNWQGRVEPMYISRKALYPGLNSVIKKKDMGSILNTKYMTVGAVFTLLGLDWEGREYLEKYEDCNLQSCKNIFVDGVSVYQKIAADLKSEFTIQEIRRKNFDADENIWEYFVSLKMDREDYITVDIGWKGTIQNAVERICQKRKAAGRGLHLLVIERTALLKAGNLEEGADIRGFTGNMWGNYKRNSTILDAVFETFFMNSENTTISYAHKEGKMYPVCQFVEYGEQQDRMTEAAQKGIISFQKTYFGLKKKNVSIPKQKREDLYKIAARLAAMPTRREATQIGAMIHDENFGTDRRWQLIAPEGLHRYGSLGYNEFVHQDYARSIEWYDGMDSILDGLKSYKAAMFHMRNSISYEYAMYAERICRRFDKFVLAGAGLRARTLLLFLKLMDETDRVEFLVDNAQEMQGETVYDFRVCSVEKESISRCYCLTSMQKTVIEEMTEQLRSIDSDVVIYNIYSQE